MSWRVSAAGFEGPFDLLLSLVTRQKVDIGAVSVAQIADQYLAEVERMGEVDLEVASDFVLVASTLLELKAASLMPDEPAPADAADEELAALSPQEMRDVLVARLLAYRQFRGAAAALAGRMRAQSRMHPRTAGPGPEFAGLAPDYLAGVPLERLARIAAGFAGRRERVLLESEHIAPPRVPLETRVEQVDALVRARRELTFDELVGPGASVELRVVSLLALLELAKRHKLTLEQPELFGQIQVSAVAGAEAWGASDAQGISADRGAPATVPAGEAATSGGDERGDVDGRA